MSVTRSGQTSYLPQNLAGQKHRKLACGSKLESIVEYRCNH